MVQGWAWHFAPLAQERGFAIENAFLGAVGSLYAVAALQKRLKEGASAPDVVLLEYMLNDILLANDRTIGSALVHAGLAEIVRLCAAMGSILVPICLEPRYRGRPSMVGPIARVRRAWRYCARFSCVASPMFASDLIGRPFEHDDYFDDNHLNPAASNRVALSILARLESEFIHQSRGRLISLDREPRIIWRDAGEAVLGGAAERIEMRTKVFAGVGAVLPRPARAGWLAPGRLVAILVCSQSDSGAYVVRAGEWSLARTAASSVVKHLSKFVTLHYFASRAPLARSVAVETPDDPASIAAVRWERAEQDAESDAPFASQKFVVLGALFYRDAPGWRTALERLEAVARDRWRERRRKDPESV